MSDLVMRATIWLAIGCFVLAQIARRIVESRPPPHAAWPAGVLAAGAGICAVHIIMAYAWTHGWSHAHAVSETARITASVYGVAWGGGVYVNFLFLGVWIAEAAWWWRAAASARGRRRWLEMAVRAFFFVLLFNATVVFTHGLSRVIGSVMMAALLWAWRSRGGADVALQRG